jgi:ATP-dependent Clp protease ATP-binding subunit ClpC
MPIHRFPTIVLQDAQGLYTASPVEELTCDDPSATAATASKALADLKQYLTWLLNEEPWREPSDLVGAELLYFKVPVRTEYRAERHTYPAAEPFKLRLTVVAARRKDGPFFAVLPGLAVRFHYHETDSLRNLVFDYAQRKLNGLTPRELSRYVAPARIMLEEIIVRTKLTSPKRDRQPLVTTLGLVAESLGDRAARRRFPRAWLRDALVANLAATLAGPRANVLLLGPTGVGKTSVLAATVRHLDRLPPKPRADGAAAGDRDDADDSWRPRHRFWLTSAARLIAGMQYLGQWEQRCQDVIEELSGISGVLCVENLLELVRTGGQGPNDSLGSFFLPYLARGELRMVAEATASELAACRSLLPGLADVFQVVPVAEFDRSSALILLDKVAKSPRRATSVPAAEGAVEQVYQLFRRFQPYQAFPGPVVRFVDDLFERAARERLAEVTREQAIAAFVRRTGLPERFLRDDLTLTEHEVTEAFRGEVIGQEDACRTAARIVVTFKAGLNDPRRPLGVLLFCGPTGVGKTQLAKAISRYFFGGSTIAVSKLDERLVRLDMSEYAGYDAADRLLGRQGGPPSELIKRVRQQPFVVVLLDEIEKAAPDVFDMLLGMFDEGRLTDTYGRTTTFRSAVIVMTSNLGADRHEPLGFDQADHAAHEAAVSRFFRPEFFNRIDAVVNFQALSHESVLAITRKELAELALREGFAKYGIRLTWSDHLVEGLAVDGYDARFGARPLQRVLEAKVVAPLARWLNTRSASSGREVRLDLDEMGKLAIGAD